VVILAGNWLLEGKFSEKWQRLKQTRLFFALESLFIMYLVGSFYSSQTSAALDELRIALPMVAFPVVIFSSAPIGKQEVKWTLWSLILGCVINTLWCSIYAFVLHHVEEVRNLSRFMSHIRLGMFVDMAIVASVYLYFEQANQILRWVYLCLVLYFLGMLVLLSLVSGLVLLLCVFAFASVWYLLHQKKPILVTGILVMATSVLVFLRMGMQLSKDQLQANETAYNALKKTNAKGRGYICFDSLGMLENGNYVFRNIQMEDLKRSWNARVPEDTFSYAPAHNLHRYDVLLRYLSSASLPKDADGVKSLTAQDVAYIRANVTNYNYPQWWFLHKRLYELINEYASHKNNGDVNGHSFAMRWRFWQAAYRGILEAPLFGVGLGDVQHTLNGIYETHFPELDKKFYLKPHNQFLSITLALGLLGLVVFLIMLLYPVWFLRKQLDWLYAGFFVVLLLSFLTEDTLGTQAGMGYYMSVNTLLLAAAYFKKQQILVGSPGSH
jgi:O-antigen ligase